MNKRSRFLIWSLAAPLSGLLIAVPVTLIVRNTPVPPIGFDTHRAFAEGKSGPKTPPSAQQQQAISVSIEQALYLIRSTLLTLNDANRSGNYTVMRDLAAPDFQAHNTAADLAQSFADLRRRNFDLYGAALLAPQLSAVPAIDEKRMLRLTGYIPTRPLQINFDLLFEAISGQWRLYGISITTPEAAPPAQGPPAKPTAPAKTQ